MKQKEVVQVSDQVVNIDPKKYEISKKIDSFHILEMILKMMKMLKLNKFNAKN